MEKVELEVIIIDDNSSDDTLNTVLRLQEKDNRVIYFRNQSNKGPGYSRLWGYMHAKGDYIVFADDDDYYTDSFFYEKAVSILQRNKEIAVVCGNTNTLYMESEKFIVNNLNFRGKVDGGKYLDGFMITYKKPQSTFSSVFRKDALNKAHFETMKMMNDAPIYMRALLFGDIYALDDVVGVYRIHNSNITRSLSSRFILDNLKEKRFVSDWAKKIGIKLSSTWLQMQFDITTFYYFSDSRYTFKDIIVLYYWGIKNGTASMTGFLKRILAHAMGKK